MTTLSIQVHHLQQQQQQLFSYTEVARSAKMGMATLYTFPHYDL